MNKSMVTLCDRLYQNKLNRCDMTNHITVRKALESDSEALIRFNIAMALETERKHLTKKNVDAGVINLFRKPEYGFYMVAEVKCQIVGSLMITKEWSDWRNGLFWWIQSVYVNPGFRRQGLYRSLYQKIRKMAKNDPEVCGCRLYVEKDNEIAHQTYSRLGMSETHYKIFEELLRV